MQQLLEYVFFVLDSSSEPIDQLSIEVTEEIKNYISKLSIEELESIFRIFSVYENYYSKLIRAGSNFIDEVKKIDLVKEGEMGILAGFAKENACITERRNKYFRRNMMFGKICDIAENVLFDRKCSMKQK